MSTAELAKGLQTGHLAKRGFKPDLTHEQILRIAARRGSFHVGVRYRDSIMRTKTTTLRKRGLIRGGRGKRFGDGRIYHITEKGHAVLKFMEKNA